MSFFFGLNHSSFVPVVETRMRFDLQARRPIKDRTDDFKLRVGKYAVNGTILFHTIVYLKKKKTKKKTSKIRCQTLIL